MGQKIRKNDTVMVISGRYKGVVGRVLASFPKKETAVVERVNVVHKHTKSRGQQKPGGIIEKEMPIRVCKLMLVDPKTGRASKFRNEWDAKGNKVRRSKATGNEV